MNKLNMFISEELRLDALVKGLHLEISEGDHYRLVSELYRHIEHTRRMSYKDGYEQGKFDEKIESLNR
jgi:hypothetical protein